MLQQQQPSGRGTVCTLTAGVVNELKAFVTRTSVGAGNIDTVVVTIYARALDTLVNVCVSQTHIHTACLVSHDNLLLYTEQSDEW